jgi:hypothetical protein
MGLEGALFLWADTFWSQKGIKEKRKKKKVVAGACRRRGEEVGAMEKGANTRRRRLVERGTDRLAFITGQTRSLSADAQSGDAFCFS